MGNGVAQASQLPIIVLFMAHNPGNYLLTFKNLKRCLNIVTALFLG
jgi:hypothetical protein